MAIIRFLMLIAAFAALALPRLGMSETEVRVESRPSGVVADLPLTVHESIQPFLRGGAQVEELEPDLTPSGRPRESSDETILKGVVGAGVSFYLSPRHEIRTSYEYQPQLGDVPGDRDSERSESHIGIGYHFNF
ncbi:MAG: hypothetical protein JRC77_07755 [Deltaproteobacteria bacterium]|nr:hypothetical protein [Deltaproteobacteria bacterium]